MRTMQNCNAQSDEAVVEKARRLIEAKRKLRWIMLLYATSFLGLCAYVTVASIRKVEDLKELSQGFVFGLAMAVAWTTFGVLGGLCLGKFLVGVGSDFRSQELLVRYHDRLRDLGQLPGDKNTGQSAGRV